MRNLNIAAPVKQLRDSATGSTAAKMPARRHANRFTRWLMWSPRNFNRTVMVVGAVLFLAISAMILQGANFLSTARYERDLALYQQQEARKAREALAATPTVGTPTPTPAATAPRTAQAVAEPAAQSRDVQKIGRTFVTTWSKAATYKTTPAWTSALQPVTAQSLVELLNLTDRALVPTVTVAGMTSVKVGDTAHVSVLVKEGGSIALTLKQTDGLWKVVSVEPEVPAA